MKLIVDYRNCATLILIMMTLIYNIIKITSPILLEIGKHFAVVNLDIMICSVIGYQLQFVINIQETKHHCK